MAFDEHLADRLRSAFQSIPHSSEKKMFGGIAYMVSGHMVCGIVKDALMARVGPNQYESSLALEHVSEMNFTGKPMKGMVYVAPEGIETELALQLWIERCLVFVNSLPPKEKKA